MLPAIHLPALCAFNHCYSLSPDLGYVQSVTAGKARSKLLKYIGVEELSQRQLQSPHSQRGLHMLNGTFNRPSNVFYIANASCGLSLLQYLTNR